MSEEIKPGQEERSGTAPGATAAVANPAATTGARPALPSLRDFLRGDLGTLPVLVALVLIAIYFQIRTGGLFLSPRNLSELTGEIITIGVLGLGSVLVLLIGEIDLSLAVVSALCGAVMGILSERAHLSPVLAILGGLVAGMIIGAINGFFVSVLRMPSFIVTLAGLIGYQGLLSHILFPQVTLPLHDASITNLAVTNLCPGFDVSANCVDPFYLGIVIPVVGLVIYAGSLLLDQRSRRNAGLPLKSGSQLAIQIGGTSVAVLAAVALFSSYRGVPLPAMILVGLMVLFWLILRRTAFGRHVYAVGGNAEASRRAGINVVGLRIVLFTLASTLGAVGGILEASREFSAPGVPGPTLLLNAIAAAVIGGVSLFGGRGSVWAVVLGSLIVGSLLNGLNLTNQGADVQQIVEGVVLLLAVLADALLRRRNATGLR